MRDIDGIDRVIAKLAPHRADLEKDFNVQNEKFKTFIGQPHDALGRLLKCHLVVEHYMSDFLKHRFDMRNIEDAKLTFFNKAALLPSQGSPAAFVKPGIIRLNKIRNRVCHNLGVDIEREELGPIRDVLSTARQGAAFAQAIDAIEAFTTVACTWLLVAPPALRDVFDDAFAEIAVNVSNEA